MAAIRSTGIGSGLDVEGIVTGLMNIERQPITNLAKEKTNYEAKISAYGTLKSSLSTFQTAVSSLSDVSKFNVQSATSADTSVFTATSNGTSTVGSYGVTVSQLAASQKLASNSFTNTYDTVGTGTLTIAFGTYDASANTFTDNPSKAAVSIAIPSGSNTLAGIRDAINAAGASVTASIVNEGSSNRLVITSKDTGETSSLKITATDADGNNTDASGLSQLAYDPTATAGAGKNLDEKQQAKNALLNIDGIDIVKQSNTITDAIEGVTLNLLKTSDSSVSLNLARDNEAIKTSVTSFVNAYNALNTTLRSLTKYDPDNPDNNGELLGDATARALTTQIKAVLTSSVGTGNLKTLSDIGVAFQTDGTLALNSDKLTKGIENNFTDIAGLFAKTGKASDPQISFSAATSKTQAGTYAVNISQLGSDSTNVAGTINGVSGTGINAFLTGATGDASEGLSIIVNGGSTGDRGTVTYTVGFAAQLDQLLKDMLSDDGILNARTTGINSSIKRIDTQTTTLEDRMVTIEANLRAQYTNLDTLISSMNTTSTFLTQQIAQINANS